jgi:hypothetical protein
MTTEIKRIFKVDGKPFYPLGRHHLYMGGYTARDESMQWQYHVCPDLLGPDRTRRG